MFSVSTWGVGEQVSDFDRNRCIIPVEKGYDAIQAIWASRLTCPSIQTLSNLLLSLQSIEGNNLFHLAAQGFLRDKVVDLSGLKEKDGLIQHKANQAGRVHHIPGIVRKADELKDLVVCESEPNMRQSWHRGLWIFCYLFNYHLSKDHQNFINVIYVVVIFTRLCGAITIKTWLYKQIWLLLYHWIDASVWVEGTESKVFSNHLVTSLGFQF